MIDKFYILNLEANIFEHPNQAEDIVGILT